MTNDLWRVDETYVRVGGKWKYLFRAVDKHGQLIDFMLSEQVAELLAKEQRLPGRSNAAGLDPVFKEINAEKILPLSIEEVQANFRKYLEEYRSYFGK